MALRRDVACCVKIVGILAVDGLCDMTCQHYDQMMTRDMMTWRCKNRYDAIAKTEDDVDDDVITRCWLTDACDENDVMGITVTQFVKIGMTCRDDVMELSLRG